MRLQWDELRNYKWQLARLAREAVENGTLRNCDESLWNHVFGFKADIGRQVYESFTNDELLATVSEARKRVGRTPCVNDIYCIYVRYIRQRFASFPNALAEAGYDSIGDLSEDTIKARLSKASPDMLAAFFHVLCSGEMKNHLPSNAAAKRSYRVLAPLFGMSADAKKAVSVLRRAEHTGTLVPMNTKPGEYDAAIDRLKMKAAELGRTPLRSEISPEDGGRLWLAFGGWRNVLKHAGLNALIGLQREQAKREYMIKTAGPENLAAQYYKRLTEEDIAVLNDFCEKARSLNRIPSKACVSPKMYERVSKIYGSWQQLLRHMGFPANNKSAP